MTTMKLVLVAVLALIGCASDDDDGVPKCPTSPPCYWVSCGDLTPEGDRNPTICLCGLENGDEIVCDLSD